MGSLSWDVPIAVGSKQRLCIHLMPRNGLQSKSPRPGVSDAGLTASAAAMSHLVK